MFNWLKIWMSIKWWLTCTCVLYNSWMSKLSMFKRSFSLQSSHVVMPSRFVPKRRWRKKKTTHDLFEKMWFWWKLKPRRRFTFTWADFGAKPPLDAVLVDVLQTACTAARLNQGVGCRFLPHLADSAQVAFFLIRILQQQSEAGQEDHLVPLEIWLSFYISHFHFVSQVLHELLFTHHCL